MIKLNRFNMNIVFVISFYTLIDSVGAAGVINLGEYCFRIRDANNNNQVRRLMRIELTNSGTRSYGLTGVIKDLNNQQRYWITGSSYKLDGSVDIGIDAWYSGQLHGVRDVKPSGLEQYQATFTHSTPFNIESSQFRDSNNANETYKMALSRCTDPEFEALFDNQQGGN